MSEKHLTSRTDMGIRVGQVGLGVNLVLVLIKVIAGLSTGSLSILADGMNNLGDSASAIFTLVGFKISQKPADKGHPYGHERAEYIASLFIAIMILIVGAQFLIQSIERIFNPEPVQSSLWVFLLLLLSIGMKWGLTYYYQRKNQALQSTALEALKIDSRNDALMTGLVLGSYLIEYFWGWQVDGYAGILVSIFILYSGYLAIKESLSELLGEKPSPELIQGLVEVMDQQKQILGYHDLHIHKYGPETTYASVHIEVDADIPLVEAHEIAHQIEQTTLDRLGIELVTHLDPQSIRSAEYQEAYKHISHVFQNYRQQLSFHDLQLEEIDGVLTMTFDVVVDETVDLSDEALYNKLTSEIYRHYNTYPIHIDFDHNYILNEKKEEI